MASRTGQHQPISGGVENEADLIGGGRTTAGATGGELCLMQLDQVFGLAARTIQTVVDPHGRADIEARDDEADVEAEPRRLNTGDGSRFAIPGLGLVARLGIAAQNRQVLDGASRADVAGDFVDFSGERLGIGQTEDVVDAIVLVPTHRLRPSIVPVATEHNSRLVPSCADVTYQAAQIGPGRTRGNQNLTREKMIENDCLTLPHDRTTDVGLSSHFRKTRPT
jgi:hypothetical protein